MVSEVPHLRVEDLRKAFGSVVALDGASLDARRGEVTAIVGDNGAGKSTLIKCVAGVHRPDSGRILLDGQEARFASPREARAHGIETVYQDLALVDTLTVWQNVFLSRELRRGWGPVRVLDRKAMARRSREMLAHLGIGLPSVAATVERLSGGQRQAVAIGRAVGWGADLVIMDEPTAALGVRESAQVEELILQLRDQGLTIVLISHNFDQVLRLSDAIWVLRQGQVVGGRRTTETSGEEVVRMITGVDRPTRAAGAAG